MKKNGKYCNGKKSMNMKPLAILLALTLLVGCAIGGTIAWLTANATPVTNTFTVGDIEISLTEHKLQDNGSLSETETTPTNTYSIIPGDTVNKDPYVTVMSNSEACYVFIKVVEKNNIDIPTDEEIKTEKAMQYEIAEGWTELTGVSGVYYRSVAETGAKDSDPIYILEENKVAISEYITKEHLDKTNGALKDGTGLYFAAAAIQSENVGDDMAAVYAKLPSEFKNYNGPTASASNGTT